MSSWYNYTLNEMKINEDLTMEDIYKVINDNSLIGKNIQRNLIFDIKNKYKMDISHISNTNIMFGIAGRYFNIFLIPIKYKMKINNEKEINLDIVCISQLSYVISKFTFNSALIYCGKCNKNFFPLTYDNLKKHENHLGACIKESISINKIVKNSFNGFFKEGFKFINTKIKPLEYEPNFMLYFKHSEIIIKNDELEFFKDKNQKRMKLIDEIYIASQTPRHFFGQPGKGKTFFLIGILKYIMDHKYVGTFYINCKALYTLDKPIKIKQLIIDEIPFLFYDNYEDYLKCFKKIIDYDYDKNNSSFFDLINLVIDQIIICENKKKSYVIVFDQYKDEFDAGGEQLAKLNEKLIIKKNEKIKNTEFCLLTFSSMNNSDIRQYKIEYIKQIIEKENKKGYPLLEIDNLEYNLSIDNGGIYDINLNRLGNGLKHYNILKYYYSEKNNEEMKKYIKEIKSKIRDNLLIFFNINKSLRLENDPSYLKIIGSFSTDVLYNKDNLLNIIENIPFKYFDIIQVEKDIENESEDEIENNSEDGDEVADKNENYPEDIVMDENNNEIEDESLEENDNKNELKDKIIKQNENQYKIVFCFPLVGEVINEIYNDIINTNPSIYNNFTKFTLDGGAKGKFFEKIVTYYLNIESSIYKENKCINYFIDYPINYHDQVEVLVLNNNEAPEKLDFMQNLKNGIYLITQNRYNGKYLDIAILKVSDEKNELIGIQISIRKNKIFTMEQIVESLSNLKQNIYYYYDINVNKKDLYFCYIFDWNNNDKNNLIKKCDKKGVKYFFFDVMNNCFKNFEGEIIKNLKLNLLSFESISPESKQNETSNYILEDFFPVSDNTMKFDILQDPIFKLNQKQIKSIKQYFKNHLKLTFEPKIIYKLSIEGFFSTLIKYNNSFCITNYEGNDKINNENTIVMHDNSMMHIVKENGRIYSYSGKFSRYYDYYIVIK